MLSTLYNTIRRHALIPPECHVLVGVSGGADSVALLYALHNLRPRLSFALTAAHLNHGLRGAEADADAEFVQSLAWRLGVPCVVERVDVAAQARRQRVSVEMAGRTARYDFFARVAQTAGADRVATAHHADDQVETLLLRLLRGTGSQGLGGMAYESSRDGLRLIRPLLDVRHHQAVSFLEAHGLAWREDASNADPTLLRNRVRHELLPFLEERFQPSVRTSLARTAAVLREEQAWMDELLRPLAASIRTPAGGLRLQPLLKLPLAARRRILLSWLIERHVDPARVDYTLLDRIEHALATPATRMSLPGHLEIIRTGSTLELGSARRSPAAVCEVELSVPGEAVWEATGLRATASVGRGFRRVRPSSPGAGHFTAEVSEARRGGVPFIVRTRRPGDRIAPLGLKGSIKVQDVLVDLKVPRAWRDCIPVFTCRDEVVWVPGYRIARAWAVTTPRAPSVHLAVTIPG